MAEARSAYPAPKHGVRPRTQASETTGPRESPLRSGRHRAHSLEAGLRAWQLDNALSESVTLRHSSITNVFSFDYSAYNPRIVNGAPYDEYANAEAERSRVSSLR
jgi:hypothetical protein